MLECHTCGESFDPADLSAVMFHEHLGITDRIDLSGVERGRRVEEDPDG
jgi:hypothetical protein